MNHIIVGRGNYAFLDGSVTAPSMFFANEPTLGFYRLSAGIIGSSGILALPNGTAVAPSLTFASDPTKGFYSSGAGQVSLSIGGAVKFTFYDGAFGIRGASAYFALGDAFDVVMARKSAGVLQLGADAAGVTNQMFKACDRITSDGVGANLTIAGGRNRGASAGGSIIFQTSPAAGAGVAGTLADVATIDSSLGIVSNVGLVTKVGMAWNEINSTTRKFFAYVPGATTGQLNLEVGAQGTGIGVDVGTDGFFKVRTRAQNAYATVDALAYQVSATPGIDATITTAGLVGKTITFSKGIVTGFA